MASAQTESDEEHDSRDLRIVLLGVSGAGKSAIGNAILGREAFKESRTRESEIQTGRVEDRNISIIDTPGFFNTQLTDEEIKKQMMKSLYLSDPGPHVFLLVINLETFREEQRNIVQQIQQNFGEEALKFTMVLFIGREKVSRRVLNQIIESQETQKMISYFEGRFHVINSKNECDSSQIIKLLKSIDEMMKNNGERHYSNEIYLKNQRKLREQERMKQGENRLKQEEARMKEEQVWKRHTEMKKIQDDSDTWKQKGAINQEEEIKMKIKEEGITDDNDRKKENVCKKKTQYLRENEAAVQENLRRQMESRREKERQRWKLKREITQENPSRQYLRIMILGKSDVGKTATANTILGRDVFRAGAVAGTLACEKQDSVVSGRAISIIDTPGLLDAPWIRHFQHQLERDIEECLDMSVPGPHVFLLVIRLNGRHTEEEKNTVKWIQENFGEDALRHTIVLFTHADLLKDRSLDQYIRKSPDLQSLIDSCGGRFHLFNNQDRHNQHQVTELLEKIEQLIKDNGGEHYAYEKSRKKKQEDKGLDNSEQATEKETELNDHLFRLMMGLELSEMALRLSLARAMAHSNLSRQSLRIVLLGLLSTGKSSAGNTILGRKVFQASPVSATESCEKQTAVVSGRTVSVVDTPPLIDRLLFMDHRQSEIEKSLEMSAPGPHVFLLVINLIGFTEERKNTVEWFQENLERDALNHTIVLFTHADWINLLTDEPLIEYIKKHSALKSLIDSCGGRYYSLDNAKMQNRFQVLELLMKIDEMLEKNGGTHYTKQNIFKRAQIKSQSNTEQDDSGGCEIQ
ncbi:GTPase IMAP family member 8-like isoform X2 [Onychostoma macrolepis]|uniref:GTPase IMAP family member 8-like isoform X2 n=1 Tax=Onychostoma macrolepis TaxID=369639 RepID=UPI00272CA23C|nr:GTPase IMAP family member 8-like isoform X2 [Onychostoma macrolepis]